VFVVLHLCRADRRGATVASSLLLRSRTSRSYRRRRSIDDATVLLANGLIEAGRKKFDVPGDARVIDGKGLTLFPGMIDALTNLAQKERDSDAPARRPPRGPVITGPKTVRRPHPGERPTRLPMTRASRNGARPDSPPR
jgi:imidazolonepropionase-like amidohydrolase